MATDVKKHTTIAAGEAPKQGALAKALLSISDVVPTANATEQAQIVNALSGTDVAVSTDRPLTTTRGDARALHQIEVSRGGAFVPISGVLWFSTLAAATSWAQANPSLLSVGDRCVAANLDYRWNGNAWRGVLPYGEVWAGATAASGIVTVNHPLGAEPAAVVVTDRNSGGAPNTRKIVVSGVSTTQIQFYVTNGGNALASNPVEFYWLAYPA
ncbi:hypothetical protein QE418_000631 [Microbacterium testaceum]|uniref:hypothetical protein n=1 Tax=Microbacterium TaxID=33882 RepID=UPI0027839DEF|nr:MULTISPECIES: hypothetical protein [Microbacterium]MDQ1111183.1 hypothetical protein [Microbacterium testaceum]MDR6098277.1 hypothetical protein [Microbacterium sp. SORGH_AS_0454]